MVPGVCDIDISIPEGGYCDATHVAINIPPVRLVKIKPCPSVTRKGGDTPCGCYDADGVVHGIRNIDVAGGVHRDAVRSVEPRDAPDSVCGSRSAGCSSQCRNSPGAGYLSDRAVSGIRDIDIVVRVHGDTAWA